MIVVKASQTKSPEQEIVEFAARVKARREALGLTQEQVATRAGISQPAFSLIEKGEVNVRFTTLLQLAHALRMAPGNLMPEKKSSRAS